LFLRLFSFALIAIIFVNFVLATILYHTITDESDGEGETSDSEVPRRRAASSAEIEKVNHFLQYLSKLHCHDISLNNLRSSATPNNFFIVMNFIATTLRKVYIICTVTPCLHIFVLHVCIRHPSMLCFHSL